MKLKSLCWLVVPLLTWTAHGQVAVSAPQIISLEDCIRLALLHNRDIQIQRYEPEIARLTLAAAYGAYDPVFTGQGRRTTSASSAARFDPDDLSGFRGYQSETHAASLGLQGLLPTGLRYTISGDWANTFGSRAPATLFDGHNASMNISLQQPLLRNFWIDNARRTIQVGKKDLKYTSLGVEMIVMTVIKSVQDAYFDLIYARENVRVQEKLLEVRDRFYQETKRKVEVGTLPPLEEKLAESQVAQVKATLISARNAVDLAQNQLKGLLGDDFVSSVGVRLVPADSLLVTPETLDLAESWKRGLNQRPELAQMKINIEKNDIDVRYWGNQRWPTFNVFGSYGRSGADYSSLVIPVPTPPGYVPVLPRASAGRTFDQLAAGDFPNDSVGVLFSMPLTRKMERSNYEASKQRRSQAILRLKQMEEVALREIDDAIKNVKTSLETVAATQEARAYAETALDVEGKKLAAGKSTAYVVLQLQGDLANAQAAEIRAKADYNKALAQLYFAEGSTLKRNNLAVEIK